MFIHFREKGKRREGGSRKTEVTGKAKKREQKKRQAYLTNTFHNEKSYSFCIPQLAFIEILTIACSLKSNILSLKSNILYFCNKESYIL